MELVQGKYLEYKDRPLVREGNTICYGDKIADKCFLLLEIMSYTKDEKSGEECMNFTVLHTPGHTPGGICLYCERDKTMFTGDTLFKRSYGRTDLKYGDMNKLFLSLKRLYRMDKEITFYPGHYDHSTIGAETSSLR
jgi:glyoxylase-like metal-dependent hydrolase (beta-lactamase superfamily II)